MEHNGKQIWKRALALAVLALPLAGYSTTVTQTVDNASSTDWNGMLWGVAQEMPTAVMIILRHRICAQRLLLQSELRMRLPCFGFIVPAHLSTGFPDDCGEYRAASENDVRSSG